MELIKIFIPPSEQNQKKNNNNTDLLGSSQQNVEIVAKDIELG